MGIILDFMGVFPWRRTLHARWPVKVEAALLRRRIPTAVDRSRRLFLPNSKNTDEAGFLNPSNDLLYLEANVFFPRSALYRGFFSFLHPDFYFIRLYSIVPRGIKNRGRRNAWKLARHWWTLLLFGIQVRIADVNIRKLINSCLINTILHTTRSRRSEG